MPKIKKLNLGERNKGVGRGHFLRKKRVSDIVAKKYEENESEDEETEIYESEMDMPKTLEDGDFMAMLEDRLKKFKMEETSDREKRIQTKAEERKQKEAAKEEARKQKEAERLARIESHKKEHKDYIDAVITQRNKDYLTTRINNITQHRYHNSQGLLL